jgi:hypothetical protein
MTTPRYSTTGEVTIAIRKHTNRTSGEARMSTKYVDGFANYLTTLTPMPGTAMTVDQLAEDVKGWDGEIEVTAKSVRVKTVHLVEPVEELDDCKLTTVPGLSELESEPVLDDAEHLDDAETGEVDDERQDDAVEASVAVAPESTRGRTNQINVMVHPLNAGVSGGRRIDGASVHTLNVLPDNVDQVTAAVLQLGWVGVGVEVTDEPATTYSEGQPVEAVKVRVRVPDVDEDGQPLRRFDVAEPVAELPALEAPVRVDVAEGYKIRTGSSDGVWWIELFRETGEVEDEVHVDTRRGVPKADVQAVVDEMVQAAEEAHLAELLAEVELYKSSQVAEVPAAAEDEEDDELDAFGVDEELQAERDAENQVIANADRHPVFGVALEPDYALAPRDNLPVLREDHPVTMDDLVPGQVIERHVHANANKVRTLAPCCGRYVSLPVAVGLYAPVACGWSCKVQYLVTRLWADEYHIESVARFIVLGPTLVVSQYYPGRGKKAS